MPASKLSKEGPAELLADFHTLCGFGGRQAGSESERRALACRSSATRCVVAPLPPDAIGSRPGCAFASAIRSFTLFASKLALTKRNMGETPMMLTGEKSLTGSYGTFA